MSKLNRQQAERIRELLLEGKITQPKIAEQFGISRSLVSDIATGRVWKGGKRTSKKRPGGQIKSPTTESTEDHILALESEADLLMDERNILRKQVKSMSKTHGLFRSLVDEMDRIVVPIAPPSDIIIPKKTPNSIEEHLVMHLSDGHHDQIVRPNDFGGLESYDFKVSMRRAEQYIDTTLKWTQETLTPQFYFPAVTVLAYGDHTSGEIHGHIQRSYFRNMFKNALAIGQLHALMYHDLAQHFEMVNVVYVPGNHGRRSIKKDYHGAMDNWDYMVAETARLYSKNTPNINFLIPDSFSVNLDINGIGFCVFHGDDIKSSMGIPFYGLERRQRRMMALNQATNTRIRYYCCGHFHRQASLTDIDGELLMNGTWVATDAYSYNAFSGYSVPSQLIHGVNPNHGVTWKMGVHLKTEGEERGPTRYKLDLMDSVGNPL